ncbi:hypothetical protein FOCC_FOCC000633, partial [Frankliniella occidentalis]
MLIHSLPPKTGLYQSVLAGGLIAYQPALIGYRSEGSCTGGQGEDWQCSPYPRQTDTHRPSASPATMTTSGTIALLCALCALSALPAHARVFDVRPVGDDVNPYCLTCVVTEETKDRYQLIRGDDEVKHCTDHLYCDCVEHKQLKCTGIMSAWESLNPDKQECALGFSCDNWLRDHPTTAAPTSTSPMTPTTTPTGTPATGSTGTP